MLEKLEKLAEISKDNEISEEDKDAFYCEVQYKRDRSSFAGMAFKLTCEKNIIAVRPMEEKKVQKVSKYENVYVGCDPFYIDFIKEVFLSEKREYGLEILFLVYSDVRSSQKIFEELINNVDKNVDKIKTILDSNTS